jgi:hypothetical protein
MKQRYFSNVIVIIALCWFCFVVAVVFNKVYDKGVIFHFGTLESVLSSIAIVAIGYNLIKFKIEKAKESNRISTKK